MFDINKKLFGINLNPKTLEQSNLHLQHLIF